MEDCKVCDGMGYFDADFDYDRGRYVPYGPACEDCEGTGKVEFNSSEREL